MMGNARPPCLQRTSGTVSFSAPGSRYHANGALSLIGNSGSGWSATIHTTDGLFLYFNAAALQLSGTGSRAYGFQLRCLSE
ncbi:hypothetical protein [uncultured Rikenella sp.]|uniref:hypothetical protein n=1 Tax=uncultured Rikenella sp. TaxID=368003 RepID=UPI0025EDC88E|nr:hypothetical protein [uncultured Rikenella sp.]